MSIISFEKGHKERLSELFDSPMPPYTIEENKMECIYRLDIANLPFLIKFVRRVRQPKTHGYENFFYTRDPKYSQYLGYDDNGNFYAYDVLFGPQGIDPNMIGNYHMMNLGQPATTITIVGNIIKDFISKHHNFSVLHYIADQEDGGRIKAYRALTIKLGREYHVPIDIPSEPQYGYQHYFVFFNDTEHEWHFDHMIEQRKR